MVVTVRPFQYDSILIEYVNSEISLSVKLPTVSDVKAELSGQT